MGCRKAYIILVLTEWVVGRQGIYVHVSTYTHTHIYIYILHILSILTEWVVGRQGVGRACLPEHQGRLVQRLDTQSHALYVIYYTKLNI
jgi:hypothetical protein